MSNERFDKLMKQRLESVKPVYQPQAWDRFRKRLPLVGIWPWLGQYGGWLLSGLMLTGWLATLYVARQNQQLIRQLSETMRQTARQSHQPARLDPPNPTAYHRVDTVYIVKRISIEHRHVYSQPNTFAPLARRTHRVTPGGPAWPVGRPASTPLTSPAMADSGFALANNHPGLKPANGASEQPVVNKLPDGQPVLSDSLKQKPTPVPAAAALPAATPQPVPFRLSALKPRVGIESLVTACGVGLGPAIDLSLSDNLGLSIGLQATQIRSRTHRSLKDYNTATGKDFINQYQPYLPAQYDRIDDIGVHTSVISLPVSLKYYVPLKKNWSLLVQTGTYFDLAAYQQVHYDSDYQGDEQYNAFEANAQRSVFHNFIFGAGINFNRSRISAQLVPSYVYDFRSMANMPAGSKFGLRGSVWINLAR